MQPCTIKSKLTNTQGMGATQVLLFVALFGIIVYGFTDTLIQLKKRTSAQVNKEKRFLSKTNLKRLLLSDFSISLSSYAQENSILRSCALSESNNSCIDGKCCQHGVPFTIYLLEPAIDFQTNDEKQRIEIAKSSPRITGSEKNPVLYSEQGLPNCTNDCAYSIYTIATPHCPGNESFCLHAEYIKVDLYTKTLDGKGFLFKDNITSLFYPVNRNYPPLITNNSMITLGPSTEQIYNINVDPGHPSEKQTFSFSTCSIEDPTIATLNCESFVSNAGYYKVKSLKIGSTKIHLQVTDGQTENSLSQVAEVILVVK